MVYLYIYPKFLELTLRILIFQENDGVKCNNRRFI
jgi:hypothetical protein